MPGARQALVTCRFVSYPHADRAALTETCGHLLKRHPHTEGPQHPEASFLKMHECPGLAWSSAVVRGRAGLSAQVSGPLGAPLNQSTSLPSSLAGEHGPPSSRSLGPWVLDPLPHRAVPGYLVPEVGAEPSGAEQDHLDQGAGSPGLWPGLGSTPPS